MTKECFPALSKQPVGTEKQKPPLLADNNLPITPLHPEHLRMDLDEMTEERTATCPRQMQMQLPASPPVLMGPIYPHDPRLTMCGMETDPTWRDKESAPLQPDRTMI